MNATKHIKHSRYKKNIPAGSAIYIGDKEPLPTRLTLTYLNNEGKYTQTEVLAQNLIKELQHHAQQPLWLNIAGLKDIGIILEIAHKLEIHPLVIEDLLNTQHLSKVDFFPEYIFIIAKLLINIDATQPVTIEQLSFILKDQLLITFQESYEPLVTTIQNKLKEFNLAYILYAMLDTIIDNQYAIVEQKGDVLEQLEEKLIKNQKNINLGELYLIKRDMLKMRKNSLSLQNIITSLIHEKSPLLIGLTEIYMRDLQDHLLRISESTDMHYELSTNILQVYLSSMSNKTNETMKVLTLFAAIFIPLSFIASVFGMNFSYMPGLHWEWGYFTALGAMSGLGIGLLIFFRKRGWV